MNRSCTGPRTIRHLDQLLLFFFRRLLRQRSLFGATQSFLVKLPLYVIRANDISDNIVFNLIDSSHVTRLFDRYKHVQESIIKSSVYNFAPLTLELYLILFLKCIPIEILI